MPMTAAMTTALSLTVKPHSSLLPRRRIPSHLRPKFPASPPPPPPVSDPNRLELSLDLPLLLSSLRRSSSQLLSSASSASRDLLTSVSVDPHHHRLLFSCRRSSLAFLLWGLVAAWSAAAVVSLYRRDRGSWWFGQEGRTVVRRDRSLAGREVVVGRGVGGGRRWARPMEVERRAGIGALVRREEMLPDWWPEVVARSGGEVDVRAQKEADSLMRAIMDNRMSGKDCNEDDIIQLRRLCRTSGAHVSFSTVNARDSFYRAAIDFVLNVCCRKTSSDSPIKIDGEKVHHFVAGLAESIRLDSIRAAVILRAAVAAKTRSCFLQTWALDIQGKREEALEELSKICNILLIFPADEQSPEIEMVAGGLEKNLKVEQRKHLLKLLQGVCDSKEIHRTAEAALGLEGRNQGQF